MRGKYVAAVLTIVALSLCLAVSTAAQETAIYSFTGGADGGIPYAGLTKDSAGNMYGTTSSGANQGNGTVFELTPNGSGGWTFNTIYQFTGGQDGGSPFASLTLDSQGNLYGTCFFGGINSNGTVFELSPSGNGQWTLANSYDFTGGNDGASPEGNVVLDSAGNVYSTTSTGAECCGTVFQLTPTSNGWTEQTLHTFTNGADGGFPQAGLAMDRAGNLYGTTFEGGSQNAGTVFKLRHVGGGWVESVLYSFLGTGQDGAGPLTGVTFDSVGRIYGTTWATVTNGSCCGGVYRLAPPATAPRGADQSWEVSWLYHFEIGPGGVNPAGAVAFDSQGNVYGTTNNGGTGQSGVVYELTNPSWTESVLWAFTGGADGQGPYSSLVFDAAGNLYGTTTAGGANGAGVVFEVTP